MIGAWAGDDSPEIRELARVSCEEYYTQSIALDEADDPPKEDEMEITKEQFMAFLAVQKSGATNMWDARAVKELSGGVVTKAVHIAVIKDYDGLAAKFQGGE